MRQAIYNSIIPEIILKSVQRGPGPAFVFRRGGLALCCLMAVSSLPALTADWSAAEQQLAHKIVAVTGPGAAAMSVQNRSSLGRRDSDIVQNGLQSALAQAGVRLVNGEQAAASITLSLSENEFSYVWVAEIRQGNADAAVVMVSVPRPAATARAADSMPMTVRKTLLWSGRDRILDVAIVEGNENPSRIAVLSASNISFYRNLAGKWQAEQSVAINHVQPWPLDLRGRLLWTKDHALEAYLPGVICRGAAMGNSPLNCRESDDPWPLAATANPSSPFLAGFFASRRNFFTGVIRPAIGKFNTVTKFYSAAFVPREKYTLWLFAAADGNVHLIDGIRDQTSAMEWGSAIATVRTPCGAGWQVLAPSGGAGKDDSVRAYEFPDRDPVAVSAAVEFPGAISELWTESSGDSAIAIVKNRETGSYEAFRLAMACN
ncbi:MAG TPA: hypothetical protein VFA67_01740 [Candidatus Sulfotelmatobacter sp.]|nr:hypothetical protein [Candidatus Sulfotelmatobacter sp.]